jgi:two-component system sensor histidine kinase VicK
MNAENESIHCSVLQQMLDKTNQIFFIYNFVSQQIEYVNSAYERVLNGNSQQINQELPKLVKQIHPDDKFYVTEMFEKVKAGEAQLNAEARLLSANNKVQWLCLTGYYSISEKGEPLLSGIVQDITSKKEYEYNVNKFTNKKNSVLEILSHDLAGPMNTLKGMATLIEKKTRQYNDSSLQQITGMMQDVCERGVNLIRDFVNHEFLESSNVDMIKKRVDVVEKVKQAMEHYQAAENEIAKNFHFQTSSNIIYAEIDELKFMQAINNLLSNAIKFTPDQGNIWLKIEEQQEFVLFKIADDGIGIPTNLQKGLFDKFTKARRPGIRGEKSTGLGMSIIKTIVELHKGEIWFESEENQGTAFFIRLPVQTEETEIKRENSFPHQEWRKEKEA